MSLRLVAGGLFVLIAIQSVVPAVRADDPPSAAGPLLGLLKRGTLPPERVGAVAKMVSERGNEHDLAYLFSQATADEWPVELRRDVLAWLQEAADTRKLRPAGDLSGLAKLVSDADDPQLRQQAVKLAGAWQVKAAVEPLEKLAESPDAPQELKSAAIAALVAFGGETAQRTIERMLQPDQPVDVRARGVAALARIDLPRAASHAAKVLQAATATDDPAPLVDAFLNAKGGADALAAALEQTPPPSDVALLALRHMYAVGRSDAKLDAVLSRLAGINAEVPKLTEEEIKSLAKLASAEGDAARGEEVFRRADLACMRCHAVSKGGGQIGPDLSPVGASSPVDYLVKSIYDPDAQKKEEFLTRVLVTVDGQQLTGIVADRTEDKLTLKTAEGKHVSVPTADIDFEAEGKSLMPEGLVKFMTKQETLDLVKFLSMLGKPNTEYAIRSTPRMQRWRLLMNGPEHLQRETPNVEVFGDVVLRSGRWESAYSQVNGELPLDELVAKTKQPVVFVQGEMDVTAAGPVGIRLDSAAGIDLWLDDDSLQPQEENTVQLGEGRHTITLRVDTRERESDALLLELFRLPDSKTQFTVVDGQ
jgi:putative heme-binding domain-containing protein